MLLCGLSLENMNRLFILISWCLITGFVGKAQSDFGTRKKLSQTGLEYLITLPEGYAQDGDKVPVILFLHGGDRSNTKHHPSRYAKRAGITFPFLVVAPHCSYGCVWSKVDFDALLSQVLRDYNIDRSRIYVTGYSMGGYGTWSTISRFPQWFAAASPIAGGGNPKTICQAKSVTIRAYHGNQDSVTPYAQSKKLIDKLAQCEADATLQTLNGEDHWIWPQIFSDEKFYSWLLSHSQ